MLIECNTPELDWERQWTVNLDAGRVQHATGLTVEVRRDETNQWCAQARNIAYWSCEDPGRRSMLPTLLSQAAAVYLTAFYAKQGRPRVTQAGNFFPDGWEEQWTVDVANHTARHKLTHLVFKFDSRRPDGEWEAIAPNLAQWLAQNARRSTMYPVLQIQAHKIFNTFLSPYAEPAQGAEKYTPAPPGMLRSEASAHS